MRKLFRAEMGFYFRGKGWEPVTIKARSAKEAASIYNNLFRKRKGWDYMALTPELLFKKVSV
jgi:hypothetical protein